jgi:phosphoenolpyruvate carboxylase
MPAIAAHYDRHSGRRRDSTTSARAARPAVRAADACSRSPATPLLEENPVLRRSIDVRNPYVDPINLLQVELLRRLRRERAGRADEPKTTWCSCAGAARHDQRRGGGDAEYG